MKTSALFFGALFYSFFLIFPFSAFAIEDPLAVPNNKVGIHILFTSELRDASNLVNANGGDWGYVTIPIQAGDRDLIKWQHFMDQAAKFHVIPLIRLATEGDYFNTIAWRKPEEADVLDFANFLNSIDWPTKNRYIIVFNEVNRGPEWGGSPNPREYAKLLEYAVAVFKQRSPDFFIISSGLDNGASDFSENLMNEYTFMRQMQKEVLDIFFQIDGLGSHSYPNPGFSQPPWIQTNRSIASFRYEFNLAYELGNKKLPVFITETGWPSNLVPDSKAGNYYTQAFESVWNDQNVVAVTPFLLKAGSEPFAAFSFYNPDGSETNSYKAIWQMSKTKGLPVLARSKNISPIIDDSPGPLKDFSNTQNVVNDKISLPDPLKTIIKWIFRI